MRAALACGWLFFAQGAPALDLVIANGRVIDPQSGLDAVRHLGIEAGTIHEISETPLAGDRVVDATGLVVAPGFIDVHSHTPSLLGQHFNLLDGVTTQLDLEAGSFPVGSYGDHYAGGAQLNYGSSVGHFAIRTRVIEDREVSYLFEGRQVLTPGRAFVQPATAEQIEAMRALLHQGLDEGGLGIGVLLDYMTSAVSDAELAMLFDVAAGRGVPIFVHVRRGHAGDPAGLVEAIGHAERTGAPLFVCHITHSAMQGIGDWLKRIDEANRSGANIATETLSWAAGGTSISADVFVRRDWQKIFGITYADVQWTATGEWMTEESWERYSREQPEGMVNHHYVDEAWMETALKWPRMMVSTDATPTLDRDVLTNPNVSSTFSRFLGHYVRERKLMSLKEGLARITLYPAQWLEQVSSAFARKGRLQTGADADIVVFDPRTIAGNAAYGDPYHPPTGIRHVLVGGRQVVENGARVEGRHPGERLLGDAPARPTE